MLRSIVASGTVLALGACLQTSVPVAMSPGEMMAIPLEARVWGSSFDGGVSIRLSRPAYVAVFEIQPGSGTRLLYPRPTQSGFLSAGNHQPSLFDRGPGAWSHAPSASYWSSSYAAGGSRWSQPRHIFLVASEQPLRLQLVQALADARSGVLTTFRFASFSASVVMNDVLDAILPPVSDEAWTTDVFTIWPEVPFSGRTEERRTTRTYWATCNGATIRVPAGVPVSSLTPYIASGCALSASPPESPPPTAEPPTRTPVTPNKPDTVGTPVRPPLTQRGDPPRAVHDDKAGHVENQRLELERLRAAVRAGERAGERARESWRAESSEPERLRGARRPVGEAQQTTRPMSGVGAPAATVEHPQGQQPRTSPARTVPAPSRPRAEPTRPHVESSAPRSQPTRQREEMSRPRAQPTRPHVEPRRSSPPASADPVHARPVPSARPVQQAPPPKAVPPTPEPVRSADPPKKADPPTKADPPSERDPVTPK